MSKWVFEISKVSLFFIIKVLLLIVDFFSYFFAIGLCQHDWGKDKTRAAVTYCSRKHFISSKLLSIIWINVSWISWMSSLNHHHHYHNSNNSLDLYCTFLLGTQSTHIETILISNSIQNGGGTCICIHSGPVSIRVTYALFFFFKYLTSTEEKHRQLCYKLVCQLVFKFPCHINFISAFWL